MESRTQGSRSRPRTQKNPRARTQLPRTEPLGTKDKNARGQAKDQGHSAEMFSKINKIKKGLCPQIRKFPTKFKRQKLFFASSLACSKTKRQCSWPWSIFDKSKNSAVLEPRTGSFLELAGFEANAKDLTFEAKNFKLCSRELHLCLQCFQYLSWQCVVISSRKTLKPLFVLWPGSLPVVVLRS